jgi:predicted alpha/beta superfamily hydrolase
MKKMLLISLISVLTLSYAKPVTAQSVPGDRVISDSIWSHILGEQRAIEILLPENYKPGSAEKFETVYLTDGEWIMDPFSFIYKFARDENYVPPLILVALPNTYLKGANQRDRDFLPVHVSEPAISGGADKFISFLKEELIPYIENKYPCNGTRSLYGHSYGGVFSAYVLFSNPELFSTYYSTDPAYWYNNNYLPRLASERTAPFDSQETLWIAGIESTYRSMGSGMMDSVLKSREIKNLNYKFVTFPNEKHNSVRLKAIYDGLKYVYSGFTDSSGEIHPSGGIALKDKPFRIYVMNPTPELRYTLNGTEPDKTSPAVTENLMITGPAQFVAKSFSTTGKYDMVTRCVYEAGDFMTPVPAPKNTVKGGLNYSFYQGEWDVFPDFKKTKPAVKGVADSSFSLSALPAKTGYACVFDGFIEIKEEGYYLFALNKNGMSRLTFNGKPIIESDAGTQKESLKSYMLPLKKGYYPVTLEYLQKGEAAGGLQFLILEPGKTNARPVPTETMYYRK